MTKTVNCEEAVGRLKSIIGVSCIKVKLDLKIAAINAFGNLAPLSELKYIAKFIRSPKEPPEVWEAAYEAA